MKKIISLITIITMLLSITAIAESGYGYSDLTPDDACYEHVSRLTDFGFVAGYDDGTFKPDIYVTRAEAAKLICMALNEKDGIDGELSFSDVQKDKHWAYDYISLIAAKKFVEGYDDGTFRPNDTITYAEFLKIMVCLLGYENDAEDSGGFPVGYMAVASVLDIVVTGINDDIVTRGQAAIILDKALDVPLNSVNGYKLNEKGEYVPTFEIRNGTGKWYQTLLTLYHNIYTVTGTIGENENLPIEDSVSQTTETEQEWKTYDGGEVEKIVFKNKQVPLKPAFSNLPTIYKTQKSVNNIIPLGDNNSTITVTFDEEITGDLSVSVYDVTAMEYITSQWGEQITSNKYKISSLTGGHEYQIKVSSSQDNRTVSGGITVE